MNRLCVLFLACAATIALCGCGSGGSSSSSGGYNSLTVTITGLPSGITGAVTVAGPNQFSQSLSSSETMQVSAGSYTVTAKPINGGASIYEPAATVQTATVTGSNSASVAVVYSILSYNYTSIDYPGAQLTLAAGINSSGQITGSYMDSDGNYHGFLYTSGQFASFQCAAPATAPGSVAESWAYGINDSAQIVGYCLYVYPPYTYSTPGFAEDGFLFSKGSVAALDYPGVLATFPAGINNAGTITGSFEYGDTNPYGEEQGFIDSGDTFVPINVANANDTEPQSINSTGTIVGNSIEYNTAGVPTLSIFTYSEGSFTFLPLSGQVGGLNDFGQIAGYDVPYGTYEGFLYMSGNEIPLIYPNAESTFAAGLNNNAQVVGYYIDPAYKLHGFLATPAQ